MKIEWFGLAEGVAEDSRGSLTLVGFDTRDLTVAALPTMARRVAVLVADLGAMQKAETVTISTELLDPDGSVIAEHAQEFHRSDDSPSRIQVASEFVFEVSKEGVHTFQAAIVWSSGTERATTNLRVVVRPVP